jgi:hypothetical protein
MSFRTTGLLAEAFQHLFALSDEELAAHNPVRRIAAIAAPAISAASASPIRNQATN